MKKTVEEHAARFSEKAAEYDDSKSDEYHACASLVVDYADPDSDDVVLDLGPAPAPSRWRSRPTPSACSPATSVKE